MNAFVFFVISHQLTILFAVPCVEFLERQAKSLDLTVTKYYPGGPQKPIVVLSWTGTQPKLPTIVLNSHMDVVPVFEEHWTHPPFAADIDEDGRIFARGAQDMKCVGVQYLAAIRALKRDNYQPKRTIHVIFVPGKTCLHFDIFAHKQIISTAISIDEEIGGVLGMKAFAPSDDFKALNVGFSLDEGYSSPTSSFKAFYAERTIWRFTFKCSGNAGHGSLLLQNTAGEKVNYLLQKFFELRKNEVQRLESNPELTIGDVTTVNLTMINGGVQGNVIPPIFSITFDVRLAIDVVLNEFEEKVGNSMEYLN